MEEADKHALGKLLVTVLALMVSTIFGAMVVRTTSTCATPATLKVVGVAGVRGSSRSSGSAA